MASSTLLAAVVQQLLSDVFPDCVLAIEAHRVGGLYLDDAFATVAGDPQNVARNLGQPTALNGDARPGTRAWVGEH